MTTTKSQATPNQAQSTPGVGLIIIGDEILSGKRQDKGSAANKPSTQPRIESAAGELMILMRKTKAGIIQSGPENPPWLGSLTPGNDAPPENPPESGTNTDFQA